MNQYDLLPSTIERLQAELILTKNELSKNKFLFESIVESSLAGYWVWNVQNDSVYLSPSYKNMFGYADHELPNSKQTVEKLAFEEDMPRVYELLAIHIEEDGKRPYKTEVRYHHKDGSTVSVICTGSIMERDAGGKPLTIVGCHMNISDIRRVEDLKKYSSELEIKNREMEQFAYVASHDLQEPLNTIKALVNLLSLKLAGHPDNDIQEFMDHIENSTEHMSDMIRGLLEYSRIGKESIPEMVNCKAIVKDIIEDFDALITTTQAHIEVDSLPVLHGYKTELRIVFQNLISNALKYRNEKVPIIKISAEKSEQEWKFSVADNGIGISPQDRIKIFQLYHRLHSKSQYKGHGIGLAHCIKIIDELHHGKIWVESNIGGGSIFYFTIPLAAK